MALFSSLASLSSPVVFGLSLPFVSLCARSLLSSRCPSPFRPACLWLVGLPFVASSFSLRRTEHQRIAHAQSPSSRSPRWGLGSCHASDLARSSLATSARESRLVSLVLATMFLF